jgi:hypothetical protein
MNAFYEHHKDNISFGYRCFDRLLLNGLIQPFQPALHIARCHKFRTTHAAPSFRRP